MRHHYIFRKEEITNQPFYQADTDFQTFIEAQPVHSLTSCTQYANQLTLHFSEEFLDEVYALFPIGTQPRTLIIYKDHIRFVNHTPINCAQMILTQHHYLNYVTYCKTISLLFSKTIYKIPVATKDYVLFPIEAPTNQRSTVWVNPAQISTIDPTDFSTIVTLSNNFSFNSPVQKRALQNLMTRAFIVWGIVHQEYVSPDKLLSRTHLAEFLHVKITPLTSEIFSKLHPSDYVFEKWTFTQCYRKSTELELMQQLEGEVDPLYHRNKTNE
ncbi:hypothetical protein IGI37_000791 [Enterococcus sp. AZ194]|uniref:competence protein ComK n=1 Tax=Enterococcus sp. AZ194 TaxID=2774629 RepID=UPI003F1FEEB8